MIIPNILNILSSKYADYFNSTSFSGKSGILAFRSGVLPGRGIVILRLPRLINKYVT